MLMIWVKRQSEIGPWASPYEVWYLAANSGLREMVSKTVKISGIGTIHLADLAGEDRKMAKNCPNG